MPAPVPLLVSLLPVIVFLVLLIVIDSFQLVSWRAVLVAIAAGGASALGSYFLNGWLLDALGLSSTAFSRYVAPLIEEATNALYIVYLIRKRRVGFLVDAAILGFAVGAGFALVENIEYLRSFGEARLPLYIVRGFGTAIMHGSTTCIFAMLAKLLTDRRDSTSLYLLLPALAVVAVIHSLYNHLILSPPATTGLLLVVFPLLIAFVFERSERATRDWLGVGFDTDAELLEQILSGEVRNTRVGHYLESLSQRLPRAVVGDLLCLLRIRLELSMRAKGLLLARQAGLRVQIDDQVRATFAELRYLERAVGKAGRLAISPFVNRSSRDLWQLYMLEK
jgi:RsiW-degrading membrane proteinase PrsW (M82 family)